LYCHVTDRSTSAQRPEQQAPAVVSKQSYEYERRCRRPRRRRHRRRRVTGGFHHPVTGASTTTAAAASGGIDSMTSDSEIISQHTAAGNEQLVYQIFKIVARFTYSRTLSFPPQRVWGCKRFFCTHFGNISSCLSCAVQMTDNCVLEVGDAVKDISDLIRLLVLCQVLESCPLLYETINSHYCKCLYFRHSHYFFGMLLSSPTQTSVSKLSFTPS